VTGRMQIGAALLSGDAIRHKRLTYVFWRVRGGVSPEVAAGRLVIGVEYCIEGLKAIRAAHPRSTAHKLKTRPAIKEPRGMRYRRPRARIGRYRRNGVKGADDD